MMLDRGWRQHIEREQESLKLSVNELRSDVGGVVSAIADQGSKLDQLVEGLSSTGQRAAERANAVKDEMRAETRHRVGQIGVVIGAIVTLCGATAGVVKAIVGPYQTKLEQTAAGQAADTVAIAAVREVLAQQGAGIGRNQASIDIMREANHLRDAEVREHDQDIAFAKGVAAAQGQPAR